jgi:hypothetical protein
MPAAPRTDSPIVPTFPRRLSEPVTLLACVVEVPKHATSNFDNPSVTFPRRPKPEDHYTFLDSSSNTAISSSTSSQKASPPLPHEKFPSCLSLANLGYEDDDEDDDWAAGWNIPESCDADQIDVKTRQLEPPSLPRIQEGDFNYIPSTAKVESHWSDDDSGDSIRLTRRLMARRKRTVGGRMKFKSWMKLLLNKVIFGGRH